MMKLRNVCRKYGARLAVGASAAAGSVAAFAEGAGLDLTGVQTGITNATSQGTTVGGYVVVAVATLVAIGLVIGIVKKL